MTMVDVRIQPFPVEFRSTASRAAGIVSWIVAAVLTLVSAHAAAAPGLHASPARIEERLATLSGFGANPAGGVSRVAYSDADIAGREYVISLMEAARLAVRIDSGGNLIGRRSGREDTLPPVMFGSHIDSVPQGGNYDGNVGVIGAIEAIEILNDRNITTRHPLELIVFSNEEGGLVGSRAMTGGLDDRTLAEMSQSGFTIAEGLRRIGGDPAASMKPTHKAGDLTAFLELHIEQGAILDEADIDIGIVEGIVGIRWWDVQIEGIANHAGTTPMRLRRDALVAAARFVLAVEDAARTLDGEQVATVGRIAASPGAPNVIPGQVTTSLEIRAQSGQRIADVFDLIQARAADIESDSGAKIAFREIPLDATPVPTDPTIREIIACAAEDLGLSTHRMASGAGHDAQEMAAIAPSGMIFVPSRGGISHAPEEFTEPVDIANGAGVLVRTILAIDRGECR